MLSTLIEPGFFGSLKALKLSRNCCANSSRLLREYGASGLPGAGGYGRHAVGSGRGGGLHSLGFGLGGGLLQPGSAVAADAHNQDAWVADAQKTSD